MPDLILLGFKTLFEIRLLHHYWLDEDKDLFDALLPGQIDSRLLTYDVRPFLKIEPTLSTLSTMDAFHCLFRTTSLGCVVLATSDITIPDDIVFEFHITVVHSDFHNYTIHSFYPKPISAVFHQPTVTEYRFKENVFVLENTTGKKKGTALYLSKDIPNMTSPAASYAIESLLRSGGNLTLISNQKGGTMSLYSTITLANMPVFLNQDDIPAIIPPAGVVGAPAKGILLTSDIPDDVYAMIRIHMIHPTDVAYSCTTAGLPKATAPVFQVRFKNRVSNWQYKRKTDPAVSTGDLGPLPITFFGNASPGPKKRVKPSTNSIQVEYDGVGPTKKIKKIISQIFE